MVLLLGLFGGLALIGGSEVHHFERHAADEIRSKLQGAHTQVRVRTRLGIDSVSGVIPEVTINASHFTTDGLPLFTEPERSKRGHVRRLKLELTDFALRGLHIDRLEATIPDCRFDLGLAIKKREIRLSESGLGDGSVTIAAKDLEAFILHKYHEIKRVSVSIAGGKLEVRGYGEFLVIATNFKVRANLVAIDGSKLFLDHADIDFDGQPADDASKQALLDTLNPVVDLNKDLHLFGAIDVGQIILKDGGLVVSGKTKIPLRPNSGSELPTGNVERTVPSPQPRSSR